MRLGRRRGRVALLAATLTFTSPAVTAQAQAQDPPPPILGDRGQPGDLAGTVLDLGVEAAIRDLHSERRDLYPEVRDLSLATESLDGSIGVRSAGPSTTVTLATDVLFAFGKSDLTPAARARIAEAADALRRAGATGVVTVAGHTDHVGTAAYNQALSQRRAQAVATALTPLVAGIGVTLSPRGYGFTRPLVAERTASGADNPAARARNRRVEITFTAPAGSPSGSPVGSP